MSSVVEFPVGNVVVAHEGPVVEATNGVLMKSEIHTLDGEAWALVSYPDGRHLRIPLDMLSALARNAGTMEHEISVSLDELRRRFADLSAREGLQAVNLAGNQFVLPGADVNEDGTAVLSWVSGRPVGRWNQEPSEVVPGWRLTLAGAAGTTVGFAKWDNVDGVNGLIEAMSDSETLVAMAGMTSPQAVARMSSRVTARRLRSARALPAIDLKKVRQVLTDAGLTSQYRSGYSAGRLRLLALDNGGRKIPVAALVMPPAIPARALTPEESVLPYANRVQVQENLNAEKRAEWTAQVVAEMTKAGWRSLDLPNPYKWSSEATRGVLAFTRLDVETWGLVEAGALEQYNQQMSMSRGSAI
jgi:hypothetical protein